MKLSKGRKVVTCEISATVVPTTATSRVCTSAKLFMHVIQRVTHDFQSVKFYQSSDDRG